MAILPHGLEEERGMTMSDDTERVSPYIMAALDEELKAAAKEHPDFADSIHYRMRRKTPPFRAGDIRRVRRICVGI